MPALSASFQSPDALAVDAAGNILVGDNGQSYAVSVVAESAAAAYGISPWAAGDVYTLSGGSGATSTTPSGNASAFEVPPVDSVGYAGSGELYVAAYNITAGNSAASLYELTGAPVLNLAAPTVSGVSPATGPVAGGTQVTVTGTGFTAQASVTFGSAAATDVQYVGPDSLTATSPGGVGTVDVKVTTAGGASAAGAPDQFAYYTPGLLRVTTSPAVPSQVSVDGAVADTWGLNWVKEPPGSHTVCFSDVGGFGTPACQQVTVASGQTTAVVGSFTQYGYVKVQTSPALPAEVTVTAQGSSAPAAEDDWGAYTDVAPGTYNVCFGAVAGWPPPACQQVTVAAGSTTPVTGTYTASAGAAGQSGVGYLRVTTSPALPSQVSVDGHGADTWGLNWLEIAPGSHTVCFSSVQGYSTPACQAVTVSTGATTTVAGTFAQRGYLHATTSPAVAGTVYLGGAPADDWGDWTDLAPGSYTVCFGAVAGYTAPACQAATVTAGATTPVTGNYTA